jgi:SAM-dependent methyltransferase
MKCKICSKEAIEKFSLPSLKRSGGPIDVKGEAVFYYECQSCYFLFANHEADYGSAYWSGLDPVHDGRVLETLRLFLWAGGRQGVSVLDYGCGKGHFVKKAREMGLTAYGADLGDPRGVGLYPLEQAPRADIVTACEVVEHFTNPMESFKHVRELARGSFAFQTAYYDPRSCGRDWWYLGPANGHVSLYSEGAFDILAEELGVKSIQKWQGYPGIQAWFF